MTRSRKRQQRAGRTIIDKKNNIDLRVQGKVCISGPSGSGKSVWFTKLLQSCLLRPCPRIHPVVILYVEWQWLYDELSRNPNVIFLRRSLDAELISLLRDLAPATVILDDMMGDLTVELQEMFTTLSHHLSCTVILVLQNLWVNHRLMVTIRRNIDMLILCDARQDRLSIRTLAHRLYPECPSEFMEAYNDAVSQSDDGVLLVDMRPRVNRQFSVRSDVFSPKKMRTFDFGCDATSDNDTAETH